MKRPGKIVREHAAWQSKVNAIASEKALHDIYMGVLQGAQERNLRRVKMLGLTGPALAKELKKGAQLTHLERKKLSLLGVNVRKIADIKAGAALSLARAMQRL